MESSVHIAPLDPAIVQTKAYEIWEAWGRPEGAAERTWAEAERQLQLDASRTAKRKQAAETVTRESGPVESPKAKPHKAEAEPLAPLPPAAETAAPSTEPPADHAQHRKSSGNGRRARH